MRILRALLWLLPAAFRREYGEELVQTARDQWRDAGASPRRWQRLGFWPRQWAAVVGIALRSRFRRGGTGPVTARTMARNEGPLLESVGQDVRHAARSLAARPGFTVVAVLTLGLGVGATTAMFSAVHSVLLRPLPYRDAGDVLVVRQTDARDGTVRDGVSAANMRDIAANARSLSHASGAAAYGFTLLEDGRAVSLRGWHVTAGFFESVGGEAAVGRTFLPEEYVAGDEKVVVLSHRTWQTRFGADPAIVGRRLVLDGADHVVVGVLPPEFKYPSAAELWAPRPPQPWDEDVRAGAQMDGVARLAPGATLADAQAELDRIAAELAAVHPEANATTGFRATGLRQHLLGDVRSPLALLMGAVGVVLLIAAANVSGLQLARASARSREYALRGALGASSRRLLRLAAVESLLLAVAGAAAGIGLAALGVDLIRMLGPDHLPRIDEVRVDATVLSFALVVAVGSALVAGLAPAVRASRSGLQSALADGTRGTTRGRRATGLRDRLVVAEIALALVLTIGAGLLLRSFSRLLDNELGFDPEGLLAVQVFAYDDADEPDLDFVRRGIDEISEIPGVEAVGITTALPLADNQSIWAMYGRRRFTLDGGGAAVGSDAPMARLMAVDGAYPSAMGVPVTAGRTFTTADAPDSPPVMMVNESFVRRHLPDRPAVGHRITLEGGGGGGVVREIVGVLADVRPGGFESEPVPEIYVPFFQSPGTGGVTFVVRTRTEPGGLATAVRDAVWSADPGQAIWAERPMTELLGDWTRQRRFNTALLVAFAGLALALAGIGVYGLMSFSVEQRVNEMGIRRALGGDSRAILRLVLGQGSKLALMGIGAGLVGALLLTRLLQGMLFDVRPFDPVTFAVISLFVAGVAVLAAFLPARRAMKVDPMVSLRAE